MNKLKVALIFGGKSNEYKVSQKSAEFVLNNIDSSKYDIHKIGITRDGNWVLTQASAYEISKSEWLSSSGNKKIFFNTDDMKNPIYYIENGQMKPLKVDCFFPVLHGKNGEDGSVQGMFEVLNTNYIGSKIMASSICMDKEYTKKIAKSEGILQAKSVTIDYLAYLNKKVIIKDLIDKLGSFPLYVKPARGGSSIGVSKTYTEKELCKAVDRAFIEDEKVIIEEEIRGSEIEVAILGNNNPIVSVPGQIISENDWYDFNSKYKSNNSKTVIPARISSDINKKCMGIALKLYRLFECKDLARVDFFVDNDGNIFFNEINTLPGFTDISMYPKLMLHMGIDSTRLISLLIDNSFSDSYW